MYAAQNNKNQNNTSKTNRKRKYHLFKNANNIVLINEMNHNKSFSTFIHKPSTILSNTLRNFHNDNKIYDINKFRYTTGRFNEKGGNNRPLVKSANKSLFSRDFSSS